ncbi:MAG: hypothetical protein M1818_002984 [Claussenomyces sp. TS43310]|nr:MAG: hypothetical protein M1818_002984 [Claussenomyces sp. TS43310]
MESHLFKSKVYVVTGGASGIGLAITTLLLKAGAYVYALDLHAERSAELAALHNERLTYEQVDVRQRARCHEVMTSVIERHGGLDGLVNNAGVCPLEGELPGDDVYDFVFDVNVRGVWNMGTEALTHMKEQRRGAVVNIGSTSSLYGVARIPLYTASKHAVLGLSRTWALDFAKYGVRVNCVAPGPTDTGMARSPLQTVMGPKFGGNKTDDELLALVAQTVPLGRIGSPYDVANQVLFFLSDAAGFTTGQVVAVSGGQ